MPDDTVQYGKRVSDLQSGITIDRDRVLHGTLHYVKDYEEFNPSNVAEQSGNYVAMQLPDTETCEITSASGTKSLPKDDRQLVWRVKDQDATLKVKTEEREETYSASGLTLEQDPATAHILHAGAPLMAQPYSNSPLAEDVTESPSDALIANRVSVVGVGNVALPDGVDLVDGHMDEASLMSLTQKQLLALAQEMGLSPSKQATKSKLASQLSSVELEVLN